MPFSWAQGTISGVSMTVGDPCKVTIVEADQFFGQIVGSIIVAADGTPWAQTSGGVANASFGIQIEAMPVGKAWQIQNNIKAAMLGNTTFSVNLQNDYIKIDLECIWDLEASRGPSFPSQMTKTDYISGYTMRLRAVSGTATQS